MNLRLIREVDMKTMSASTACDVFQEEERVNVLQAHASWWMNARIWSIILDKVNNQPSVGRPSGDEHALLLYIFRILAICFHSMDG